MNFSLYEQMLTRTIIIASLWAIFATIMSIIGIIWYYRQSKETAEIEEAEEAAKLTFTTYLVYILGAIIIIGSVTLGTITISERVYDIKNKAYIVWDGDFTVSDLGSHRSWWYLPDENGIKLEGDYLAEGKYTGRVIYGERSKVVLEYRIDNFPWDDVLNKGKYTEQVIYGEKPKLVPEYCIDKSPGE